MNYKFKFRVDKAENNIQKIHLYIASCNGGFGTSRAGHGPQLLKICNGGLEYWYGIFHYGNKENPDFRPEGNLKIIGVDVYD